MKSVRSLQANMLSPMAGVVSRLLLGAGVIDAPRWIAGLRQNLFAVTFRPTHEPD